MKTLSKKYAVIFAVIALVWAILNPLLLPVLKAATFYYHGMPGLLQIRAQELRGALAGGSTALVSLPAERVSNAADLMDEVAKTINSLSPGDAFNMISSVAIVILSCCVFIICKRNKCGNQ
jgi:hypothetical protein